MEVADCEFPDDVYLDVENDVWLKPISENRLLLGITSILSFTAGRIRTFNPRSDLTIVTTGQSLATVESGKYFGAVRSPIDARVLEFNPRLLENPRLINDSPYKDGWIAKLEVPKEMSLLRSKSDNHLLPSNRARPSLEERIRELRVHCFKKLPDDELIAIGVECSATLSDLNELLKTSEAGTVVHVASDDPFADIEMIRWSDQTGNELIETKSEGKLFHFLIEKKRDGPKASH
jgi:glycine cleavage system H protein